MPFYEREEKILNALLEKESMTTQELSARLYVSVPTLRRDLIKLEQMGKVIRTHGGAQLVKKAADEKIPFFLREQEQNDAKEIMAKKAVKYIRDGDIILLHDMSASSVMAALDIIDSLQKEGFRFVTVSQLAKIRHVRLKPGVTYNSFPPEDVK